MSKGKSNNFERDALGFFSLVNTVRLYSLFILKISNVPVITRRFKDEY